MADPAVQCIVPGAPPPPPSSKSGKKKRNSTKPKSEVNSPAVDNIPIPDATSAALIDHAPQPSEIKEGSVAGELLVRQEAPNGLRSASGERRNSPIAEIISKKLKATTKKITRIQPYALTNPEKLNDDQRRSLKTLSSLEAVAKELEEMKKAVESYEAEQANEQLLKQLEAERAEAQRREQAIAEAQEQHAARTSALLTFIRLQSLLAARHPATAHVAFEEPEVPALFTAVDTLLGEESESRQGLVRGLLSGEGDFQGIPHSRFLDLTHIFLNPPVVEQEPAAVQVEIVMEEQPDFAPAPASTEPAPTPSGAFHFMQESELENPLGESQEWVTVENGDVETHAHPSEIKVTSTVVEVVTEPPVEVVEQAAVVINPEAPTTIPVAEESLDWAAEDEGGLPSIAGLQAKFGTAEPETGPPPPRVGGQARGGRGRGRGGERGGFRGYRGERSAHRGGGQGGFRGGYRGEREGRGGGGAFRGGRDGSTTDDWRSGSGDGEHRSRGRGRGRGRGGFSEHRGTAPIHA